MDIWHCRSLKNALALRILKMSSQKNYIKSIFQLPGILLPASLVFYQAMMTVLVIYLRLGNRKLNLTAGSEMWVMVGIVLISFVFHVVLRQKKLLSSQWAWCHVIFTIQFFPVLILLDFTAFNEIITDEPHFASPPFTPGLPKSLILLTSSLLVASITQLAFWVYTVAALINAAKQ